MLKGEMTFGKAVAIAAIILLGIGILAPQYLGQLGKAIGIGQKQAQQAVNQQQEQKKEEEAAPMPEYALQNYYMFVKDKLNPDEGIQAEVEQLKAPAARDEASLAEVCSDPNRNVLDEDVAASDGKINLAGGRVVTSHDYLFAVRNDTLYDQVFVDHVSCAFQAVQDRPEDAR